MKKLFIIVAAMALVSFATFTIAAEWNFYGSARMQTWRENADKEYIDKDYDDDDKEIHNSATNPSSVYGFGHQGYLASVVEVLQGNGNPQTDGREGRKSLEIILGIYESAKTGKRVSLPL